MGSPLRKCIYNREIINRFFGINPICTKKFNEIVLKSKAWQFQTPERVEKKMIKRRLTLFWLLLEGFSRLNLRRSILGRGEVSNDGDVMLIGRVCHRLH